MISWLTGDADVREAAGNRRLLEVAFGRKLRACAFANLGHQGGLGDLRAVPPGPTSRKREISEDGHSDAEPGLYLSLEPLGRTSRKSVLCFQRGTREANQDKDH